MHAVHIRMYYVYDMYVYVDPCILMYTHLLLETCVIPLLWLKNEVIMLLLLLLYFLYLFLLSFELPVQVLILI